MGDHVLPAEQSQLFVAADLETWETHPPIDPDQDEICEEAGFRRLDPAYYAWLRHRMEQANRQHRTGRLSAGTYDLLRQRFSGIHDWALRRFGEAALLAAVKALDSRAYDAPRVGGCDPGPLPVEAVDPPPGPLQFCVSVPRLAHLKVDVIRKRAIALGWTPAQLYRNCGRYRFPLGDDYGLVCLLQPGDEITQVTAGFVEITSSRGARSRVYRPTRGRHQ